MIKISGFIITKNEAHRIARAINSVKNIVDELIVIDSGSTDDTVSIAQELGARVVFNEWQGYVKQKSFGESLCKHDWILNIDADEELTAELQHEIREKFSVASYNEYKAYDINFVILHRSDEKARFLAPANRFIRLYDRTFCSFANTTRTTTHDAVTFNSEAATKNNIVFSDVICVRITAVKRCKACAENMYIVCHMKNIHIKRFIYFPRAKKITNFMNKGK